MPPIPKTPGRFLKTLIASVLLALLALLAFLMNRSCKAPVESRLQPVSVDIAP